MGWESPTLASRSTSVPVGFDVGEAGYDDDVVFEALEAGDGGPGDALQGGGA